MLKLSLCLGACFLGCAAFAFTSVNHQGLLPVHNLPVTENTVRVELHNVNRLTVFSNGERRQDIGELHSVEIILDAPSERVSNWFIKPRGIYNRTRMSDGNSAYVDIAVRDRLQLYAGPEWDAEGSGPQAQALWVNVNPGSFLTITVKARELDCRKENVCDRDDFGSVTYQVTVADLPATLPTTCTAQNSFMGAVVDGTFRFVGLPGNTISESGRPRLKPHTEELDAFLCFLPARE